MKGGRRLGVSSTVPGCMQEARRQLDGSTTSSPVTLRLRAQQTYILARAREDRQEADVRIRPGRALVEPAA
jgi:hypothetical protein